MSESKDRAKVQMILMTQNYLKIVRSSIPPLYLILNYYCFMIYLSVNHGG